MKNLACPSMFQDEKLYSKHRCYVLYRIPNLKFLDTVPVTDTERKEAKRVGHLMIVARPDPKQYEKTSTPAPTEPQVPESKGLDPILRVEKPEVSKLYYVHKPGFSSSATAKSEGNRFILNTDL